MWNNILTKGGMLFYWTQYTWVVNTVVVINSRASPKVGMITTVEDNTGRLNYKHHTLNYQVKAIHRLSLMIVWTGSDILQSITTNGISSFILFTVPPLE